MGDLSMKKCYKKIPGILNKVRAEFYLEMLKNEK